MKTHSILKLVVLIILSSCTSQPSEEKAAIPQTQVVIPSNTPAFTPENMAYIAELKIKIPAWINAYTQVNRFHQLTMDNSRIFFEENWQDLMLGALDEFSVASDDIVNIEPVPPDMKNTNEYLIQSADEARLMIQTYEAMIKDQNRSMLDQINVHSENALRYMKLANDEIAVYLK